MKSILSIPVTPGIYQVLITGKNGELVLSEKIVKREAVGNQ
ncbi:MAG: hypothetical protein Q8914_08620 [Bacteroidota bacterium]|nr:hypothetical protein [Bacteroidota bacterium]